MRAPVNKQPELEQSSHAQREGGHNSRVARLKISEKLTPPREFKMKKETSYPAPKR